MSYSYWNDFVDTWKTLSNYTTIAPIHINGWTNPNLIPLFGNGNTLPYSLEFIPEPWWGNDGTQTLESVVINYNPGAGGGIQNHLHSNGLFGNSNYQSLIHNEVVGINPNLPATNNWHQGQRATPIFNTLKRIGVNPLATNLENHLSIELIPWHTANIGNINLYINNNLKAIFDNCIVFAANESKRISNSKLRNKVILRVSGNNTHNLLNLLVANGTIGGYKTICPITNTPVGNGAYFKFSINNIPDVEFISIWNPGGFNQFPGNNVMDWIFTNII